MDAKKIEVRSKLRVILREMLLSDSEKDNAVPRRVYDAILESYGWTSLDKLSHHEDLNTFVVSLMKWMERSQVTENVVAEKSLKEYQPDWSALHEKYIEVKSEYHQVTSSLIKILGEAVRNKEKYCQFFKHKCKSRDRNINMLNVKSQFLKLQFFLKLYGEENALDAHLTLQQTLMKELQALKKKHKELKELDNQYNTLKNDKNFYELFKVYKELKKIEKRSVIISQM